MWLFFLVRPYLHSPLLFSLLLLVFVRQALFLWVQIPFALFLLVAHSRLLSLLVVRPDLLCSFSIVVVLSHIRSPSYSPALTATIVPLVRGKRRAQPSPHEHSAPPQHHPCPLSLSPAGGGWPSP
jgi:hypothetical protein